MEKEMYHFFLNTVYYVHLHYKMNRCKKFTANAHEAPTVL